jgi:hypothetical protein
MAPHASLFVTLGIPGIAVATLALLALGIYKLQGTRRASQLALGAIAWLAYTGALAMSGVLADFVSMPPRALLLVVPTFALPIWLSRSALGKALADNAPLSWLVGFHAFRFPLELVMHEAGREGTMPVQMSFSGASFDIVTGVTAILVALLAVYDRAPRSLLIAWNTLGTLLLANIIVIALASMPLVRAFGDDPSRVNSWVAYFPFVWLPAGCVAAALFGHLVLWRRLLAPSAHSIGHQPVQLVDQLLG